MRARHTLVILFVMVWLGATVSIVEATPPIVTIPRVPTPPRIEQYLGTSPAPPGLRVDHFVQREPGDGTPAAVETTAYLSYDADHFYVVFVCKDDPAKLRAHLTKREAILGDDVVGVILDPFHDGRRSYLFLANPLGIQMDGVTQEGANDDYNFDALWRSEGRLTDDGYVVLVSVPFHSLRFSPAAAQQWGLALGRISPRFNETAFWPYITRRMDAIGPQMATIVGFVGITPGRNLQAIPYGNFSGARFLDQAGRYERDRSARVGVDAKAVVRDTITIDATANPDFSQVESDEPQVTVNQRFEVFFPEKRPFFIENANFFDTPETLFFSRRIADPRVGLRITGKRQGWAFGALGANDDRPGQSVDPADANAGRGAGLGVFRLQREFARQSYLGVLVTDREWGGSTNRVAAVDGRWRVGNTWALRGQLARTLTRDGDGPTADGAAYNISLNRETRSLDVYTAYRSISPDFQADLGYVPRRDLRETTGEIGYDWYPKRARLLRYGVEAGWDAVWNHGGVVQDGVGYGNLEFEFPGQTVVTIQRRHGIERYRGVVFRPSRTRIDVSSEWSRLVAVSASAWMGTGINYYPAGGALPFLGRSGRANVTVTVKPSSRARIDQTYLFAQLRTRPDGCDCADRQTVYTNHILRTRLGYQFSKTWSVRAVFDYNAVQPDPALITLDRTRSAKADVLLTYMLNPWTAVYAGYTDGYENLDIAPDGVTSRNGLGATTPVGRQVFLKISYLLRY
jgi:hypothetical protein